MNRTFLNYLRDNGYNKQFNQAARDFLRNEGYEDQLNQALFKWLGSEGYKGPLAKRLADWSDNYSFVREYAVNSFVPPLVLDAGREQYATGGKKNSFDNSINFTRSSEANYIDREGLIQTADVDEPRFTHEYENGEWANRGLLVEPAATNLLLDSDSLSTQNVTVSAQAYTLHFTGTGTVTLSGASTDGPLVGTGAGEQNRVSLTFTPSTGTLTLTVSGSVSNAQLEAGQVPTSYIPTAGSTVTRAADEVVIPAVNLALDNGSMPSAVSFAMKGRISAPDDPGSATFFEWTDSTSNRIDWNFDGASLGFRPRQSAGGVTNTVSGGTFAASINAPFSLASRHGATFINGAVDGTVLTADTTPTALADLSTTDLLLAPAGVMTIEQFLMWPEDIGDIGIAEASS